MTTTDGGTQTDPELHIVLECRTDPMTQPDSPPLNPGSGYPQHPDKPLCAEMLRCNTIQDLNERGLSTAKVIEVLARDLRFQLDERVGLPHSDLIESTLTDMYQITMAYGYWNAGKTKDTAVFDLFFRRCPFGGEFAIAAGIEECIRFINS